MTSSKSDASCNVHPRLGLSRRYDSMSKKKQVLIRIPRHCFSPGCVISLLIAFILLGVYFIQPPIVTAVLHRTWTIHAAKAKNRLRGVVSFPVSMQSFAKVLPKTTPVRANMYVPLDAHDGADFNPHFTRNNVYHRVGMWRIQAFVHNYHKDLISRNILHHGGWESELASAIRAYHGNLPTSFLDIGANIGAHSLYMASHGVKTVAVEAMMFNAELLLATAALNKYSDRFTLLRAAVSNEIGPDTCMYAAEDRYQQENAGNGQIHSDVGACTTSINTIPKEIIPMATIDDAFASNPQTAQQCFGTVKVDIEGFELAALEGAKQTLFENPNCQKPCTIAFEYTMNFTANISKRGPLEIFDFLDN